MITIAAVVISMSFWTWNYAHTRQMPPPIHEADTRSSEGYEFYPRSTLVTTSANDGDSFTVRLPTGKTAQFRLYFVDSPETSLKSYANGKTNHGRIRHQAEDLGGISTEQVIAIGKIAKQFTLDCLARAPFDLYTSWDSPYRDQRYHAHVRVRHEGQARWLDELLVEQGLVRIRTKPAALPDGTSADQHLVVLEDLQSRAQRNKIGVWRMSR